MRKGWEYKKLGEVATFINGDRGKNYPSAKDFVESGVPFINAGHLNNGIISYDKMNYITINKYNSLGSGKIIKNDILFCLRGSLGKYAIVAEDSMGAIASSLVIIRPFQNADNRFIAHFLSSAKIKEYIAKNNNGSSQPNLSAKSVASFIIPLPPLSTQLAIVSELDKINELIRLKKEQLKDFDNLAQSLFYEMFGDPVENEKGWEVHLLKALCTKIGSGATPKGGSESYKEEGTSLIRSLNIHNNEFKFKDLAYIDDDQADSLNNVIVQGNDVLLNITGASVARCCIVPTEVLPARVNQHVCILRHGNLIDAKYLNRLLTNDNYQQLLQRLAKSKAATREALPKSIVDKLSIPLPPLSLQRLFAQRIEQIEREKSEVQKSIQDLENLLASRMQYWFE